MGTGEDRQFLDNLAVGKKLVVAWQREAVLALGLLYREVLYREIALPEVGRGRRPASETPAPAPGARPAEHEPRLLDRVRAALWALHFSIRAEECYEMCVVCFILFHNRRHPVEMGGPEIEESFTHLAVRQTVSASTLSNAHEGSVRHGSAL